VGWLWGIDRFFGGEVSRVQVRLIPQGTRELSQDALYARSGITKSYLSTIESGSARVTIDTIKSLADGLGVPVADLFAFQLGPKSLDALKDKMMKTIQEVDSETTPEALYHGLLTDLLDK